MRRRAEREAANAMGVNYKKREPCQNMNMVLDDVREMEHSTYFKSENGKTDAGQVISKRREATIVDLNPSVHVIPHEERMKHRFNSNATDGFVFSNL